VSIVVGLTSGPGAWLIAAEPGRVVPTYSQTEIWVGTGILLLLLLVLFVGLAVGGRRGGRNDRSLIRRFCRVYRRRK
jgi:hypothetical protein